MEMVHAVTSDRPKEAHKSGQISSAVSASHVPVHLAAIPPLIADQPYQFEAVLKEYRGTLSEVEARRKEAQATLAMLSSPGPDSLLVHQEPHTPPSAQHHEHETPRAPLAAIQREFAALRLEEKNLLKHTP
ncbi:hypothetical protein BCV69DRAFT_298938 [Microstroma glucosiphilum]|uniref:Uncharacterized protein n=1 Tax=Pseudomicrostroma glucosiphilum TaxID=1684307 RepID=A0A316U9K2_9BASI|nr:hypothetical protein BCV69DRAFT_298938 [Pseudomicrostroma glucosiphilum]PWN21161.1 hypothetical protein BCV69DRAFT_298938 [Pseudomicrostroma glucosiphilum]